MKKLSSLIKLIAFIRLIKPKRRKKGLRLSKLLPCLLYTSDAADDAPRV